MIVIGVIITFALFILSNQRPSQTELQINSVEFEKFDDPLHYYILKLSREDTSSLYIQFSTVSESTSNTANIFISKTNKYPSYIDSDYHTYTVLPNIIVLSQEYYKNDQELYITISCETNCEYTIKTEKSETMFLQTNRSIVFSLLKYKREKLILYLLRPKTCLLLYIISPSIMEFRLVISIKDNNTGHKEDIIPEEVYDNGYGVLIAPKNSSSTIVIKIASEITTMVTLGCRFVSLKENRKVRALEVVYGELNYTIINKECFDFVPNENDKPNTNYVINIMSFTEDVIFLFKAEEEARHQAFFMKEAYSTVLNSSLLNKYEVCFTSTKPDKSEKLNTETGFSFQILNGDQSSESQLYLRPLINGRSATGYLPAQQILIYRLERHFLSKKTTDIFLKRLRNNQLSVYGVLCTTFTDCQYTQEKIENSKLKIKAHVINDIFQVTLNSMDPSYPHLYVAVIYCNSTTSCKYSIAMKHEGDFITLPTQKTYFNSVKKGDVEKYIFRYYDTSTILLYIVLFSFTGKGELMLYDQIEMETPVGQYTSFGTKEAYLIMPNFSGNTCDYIITVTGISSSYYSLTIFEYNVLHKNTVIPIGEIFLEHLSNHNPVKTFEFRSNDKEEDHSKGFLISFNLINCNCNFTYQDQIIDSKNSNNNVQLYFEYNGISDRGVYNITAALHESNYTSNLITCQILIAATGISPNKQILLNEGFQHVAQFVKSFNEIIYNYPYFYAGYEEKLVISITANGPVLCSYSTDGETFSDYMSINDINKFLIPSHQLERDCFVSYICSIIIKLRRKNKEGNEGELPAINFSIQVTATNMIPVFLRKEELRLDHVFEEASLHYYTQIEGNEEGEIMINFLRGSGYAVAKIVFEDVREEDANWNHVRLPDKSEKNRLHYDYFQNKITYNSKQTNYCDLRGCELYLTVFSTEKESTLFSTFSILIRRLKNTYSFPVSILMNNYYFGFLMQHESNEYLLEIIEDYQSIFFDFNTEICQLQVKEKTNDDNEDPLQPLIYNSSFTLKASDFGRTTLKSTTVKIQIYTVALFQYFYSYNYNIRILPPILNSRLGIIELDYIQNEYCYIQSDRDKKYCRYVVKVHEYDYLTNNLFVAFHSDPQILIKLYASRTTERLYNQLSRETLEGTFPTPTKHELSSNNSTLLSEPDSNAILSTATYALVTVESPSKGKIQLVSNWGHFPKKTLLISNTLLVFYISKSKEMEVIIQGKDSYQCGITWLTGGGYVEKFSESGLYQQEINSLFQYVNILLDPFDEDLENIYNIITIKSNEKGLGFSIFYEMRGPENLDQSKLFLYSSYFYNEPTKYPLYLYTQIFHKRKDIITNIYIEDDTDCKGQKLLNYDITTILAENDSLMMFRNDNAINTTEFEGEFNSYFKIGYSNVIRNQLKDQNTFYNFNHYIINEITTASCFIPKLLKLKTLIMPSQLSDDIPLNQTKPLPYNTFIISTLEKIKHNEFILSSYEDEDKGRYMEIEIITDIDKINIEIIAVKNTSITSPVSKENMISVESEYKNKITFNLKLLPDDVGVKIDLKAKIPDLDKLKYALKYKISQFPFLKCKFKSNIPKINYALNKTKITFSNIQSEDNINIQAKVNILFYSYSLYNRNLTNTEQALLLLTDTPFKKYTISPEDLKSTTIQFETSQIPSGKYYVSIIAVTNHYSHEEMLQYEVVFIDLVTSGMEYLWIIIVVSIIVIGLAILACVCVNKKKKSKTNGSLANINDSSTMNYQTVTYTNTTEHSKED